MNILSAWLDAAKYRQVRRTPGVLGKTCIYWGYAPAGPPPCMAGTGLVMPPAPWWASCSSSLPVNFALIVLHDPRSGDEGPIVAGGTVVGHRVCPPGDTFGQTASLAGRGGRENRRAGVANVGILYIQTPANPIMRLWASSIPAHPGCPNGWTR